MLPDRHLCGERSLLLFSWLTYVPTVLSCLVLSCLVLSCLVLSCLVLSCLVLSCLVLCCLVLSCHVLSCLVLCCLVLSCLVLSRLLLSCLVLSCLVFRSSSYLVWCVVLPFIGERNALTPPTRDRFQMPFTGEPDYDNFPQSFITPNHLFFIRNHGTVHTTHYYTYMPTAFLVSLAFGWGCVVRVHNYRFGFIRVRVHNYRFGLQCPQSFPCLWLWLGLRG